MLRLYLFESDVVRFDNLIIGRKQQKSRRRRRRREEEEEGGGGASEIKFDVFS